MTVPTSYFATVRRNSFVVNYLRLNEKSGTKAYDYAAKYGLNGIYDGTPNPQGHGALILNDSSAGSALFGSTGQNVEIPDAAPLRITGNITLEMWIIPYEKEQTCALLSKMNAAVTFPAPYYLGLSSGKPFIALGNGATETKLSGSVLIPVGSPYHLVVSLFRKKLYLYINGIEVESKSLGAQEIKDEKQPVFVGALSGNTKRFNGLIGETVIYNGAISPRAVERHFKIGQQIVPNTSHVTTFDPPSYS